jgi:hypothetical protein
MRIECRDPQRAFRPVAAQPIDKIDDRRTLGLKHILDLPRLAIERIIAVDYAQFRQYRDQ